MSGPPPSFLCLPPGPSRPRGPPPAAGPLLHRGAALLRPAHDTRPRPRRHSRRRAHAMATARATDRGSRRGPRRPWPPGLGAALAHRTEGGGEGRAFLYPAWVATLLALCSALCCSLAWVAAPASASRRAPCAGLRQREQGKGGAQGEEAGGHPLLLPHRPRRHPSSSFLAGRRSSSSSLATVGAPPRFSPVRPPRPRNSVLPLGTPRPSAASCSAPPAAPVPPGRLLQQHPSSGHARRGGQTAVAASRWPRPCSAAPSARWQRAGGAARGEAEWRRRARAGAPLLPRFGALSSSMS
ncbi:hypothetical protein PVAP13_2KG419405 [Panicum virgatum]|uniref:Uncharacterized protein n=1 Tax=Panicum virgatum TaxID=38727 RepID=A0A8T0WJ32_PANVG|nr:hypothetical protein PVAP13_2KG419405 [Panicum virgatum]